MSNLKSRVNRLEYVTGGPRTVKAFFQSLGLENQLKFLDLMIGHVKAGGELETYKQEPYRSWIEQVSKLPGGEVVKSIFAWRPACC